MNYMLFPKYTADADKMWNEISIYFLVRTKIFNCSSVEKMENKIDKMGDCYKKRKSKKKR